MSGRPVSEQPLSQPLRLLGELDRRAVDRLGIGRLHAEGTSSTAATVERRALGVADRLRQLGIEAGDRVLLQADNSVRHLTALLALIQLDVSIVLLDGGESAAVVDQAVRAGQVRLVIGDHGPASAPAGLVSLEELLAGTDAQPGPDECLTLIEWFARSDALITWSRRASGRAVGVVRSGRSVLRGLDEAAAGLNQPGQVLLPLVPLSHVHGLTLLLLAWTSGCGAALLATGSSTGQLADTAGRVGATTVLASAGTIARVLDAIERCPELLQRLYTVRNWLCSGPVPAELATRVYRATGHQLRTNPLSDRLAPARATEPDDWSFSEDPIAIDRQSPAAEGRIRTLLTAVRDDPATFARIMDRIVQQDAGDPATAARPAQVLADALDVELSALLDAAGTRLQLAASA